MIEPKDGEWWMVEFQSGDKRVMRYWLRDGDSDAVWNVFHDESDSFTTAYSNVKPLYKMVKAEEHKPRTKVVYEKVESCSDTQLASMFVDGLLYFWDVSFEKPRCVPITTLKGLSCGLSCYRKVEKEIDWKDELIAFLNKEKKDGGCVSGWYIGDNDDKFSTVDIDFNLRDGRFIAMCHLVASLTDKPE